MKTTIRLNEYMELNIETKENIELIDFFALTEITNKIIKIVGIPIEKKEEKN